MTLLRSHHALTKERLKSTFHYACIPPPKTARNSPRINRTSTAEILRINQSAWRDFITREVSIFDSPWRIGGKKWERSKGLPASPTAGLKAASSTQDCRRSAGRRRVEGNGGGETPERDAWLSF